MLAPEEGWHPAAQFPSSSQSTSGPSTSGAAFQEAQPSGPSPRVTQLPLCSVTQGVVTAATGAGLTMVLRRAFTGTSMGSPGSSLGQAHPGKEHSVAAVAAPLAAPPPPPPPPVAPPLEKPAHDVVAGAMARAASQSTIHPLDTMKVRMQAGHATQSAAAQSAAAAARPNAAPAAPPAPRPIAPPRATANLAHNLTEVRSLYKGVVGAATGAGLIIGTYFAFYSTTKRFLRENTTWNEGTTAFTAGATAAVGSSVVKVPLAVCIRSVQAGVYKNVFHAAKTIVNAAGVRGLFTGFLPTILEDVPDMAVKFAVYETLRTLHVRLRGGRPANVAEDLVIGGFAGAAAAAATTPLDVVKTVMMCTASQRPTFMSAARSVMREGRGLAPFFRGVGPRALSNGLNSAIFFCFFEMIRQSLIRKQAEATALAASVAAAAAPGGAGRPPQQAYALAKQQRAADRAAPLAATARPTGSAAACLSLALPLPGWRK